MGWGADLGRLETACAIHWPAMIAVPRIPARMASESQTATIRATAIVRDISFKV